MRRPASCATTCARIEGRGSSCGRGRQVGCAIAEFITMATAGWPTVGGVGRARRGTTAVLAWSCVARVRRSSYRTLPRPLPLPLTLPLLLPRPLSRPLPRPLLLPLLLPIAPTPTPTPNQVRRSSCRTRSSSMRGRACLRTPSPKASCRGTCSKVALTINLHPNPGPNPNPSLSPYLAYP